MSKTRLYKVLVQDSDICVDVARYLNKNINEINNTGIYIRVDKIDKDEFDDDLVEKLRRKGITRLPAMITNDGVTFVGLQKIVEIFEKSIQGQRNTSRIRPEEYGSNPGLNDFWMREMYNYDKKGTLIPREDDDEKDTESRDLERALSQHQRTKQPKHRVQDEVDLDIVPMMNQKRKTSTRPTPEPLDNVDDNNTNDDLTKYTMSSGGPDAMDEKMMAAWMQNIPTGDY